MNTALQTAIRGMVVLVLAFAVHSASAQSSKRAIDKKLKNIVIPRIRFEDAPISVVFNYLKERSRALDPEGTGVNFVLILNKDKPQAKKPEKKSEKKVKKADKDDDWGAENDDNSQKKDVEENDEKLLTEAKAPEPTLSLDFDNLPLGDAIRYSCIASGMRYKVEKSAVVVMAPGVTRDNLELRFFSVDPRLFRDVKDVQKYFEDRGVTFPTTTARK